MINSYIQKHLPNFSNELKDLPPHIIRQFKVHYEKNPSALNHFPVQKLIASPELWLVGTDMAKQQNEWLQEVYPRQSVPSAPSELRSIIVCGSCKQRKVDYYQQQIRGADEPMTCFCTCLNCGARWTQ